MSFSELGLSDLVLKAVEEVGYTTPTPIQKAAIPAVLSGQDVMGIAQTGTGKTASFTLPMLTMLEKGRPRARMPRTLIIEPTRELAAQVEQSFMAYGKAHRLTVALLIGGVSFEEQNRKLERGVDVLIATPGRLLDQFERGKILLNSVELLVIDEADRMLDMGFIPDVERICKLLPGHRQTLFFSATMAPEIEALTRKFLNNPKRIEVSPPRSTASTITQKLIRADNVPALRRKALRGAIRAEENLKNAIIFCNRKRDVAILARSLEKHGFNAAALHGDMDQTSRMHALDGFRQGTIQFLVASDVAARGLDIPAVSHVFNFNMPTHAEDYIHRIGRTGRAGLEGKAFSLVSKEDAIYLERVEKLIEVKLDYVTHCHDDDETRDEVPSKADNRHTRQSGHLKRSGRSKGNQRSQLATENKATNSSDKNSGESRGKKSSNYSHQDSQNTNADLIGFGNDIPAFFQQKIRV